MAEFGRKGGQRSAERRRAKSSAGKAIDMATLSGRRTLLDACAHELLKHRPGPSSLAAWIASAGKVLDAAEKLADGAGREERIAKLAQQVAQLERPANAREALAHRLALVEQHAPHAPQVEQQRLEQQPQVEQPEPPEAA